MARITINGISIDPASEGPALQSASLIEPTSDSSDFILVQTKHPLTKEERGELAALQADILEYVPEDTYLCHYPPTDLAPIRKLNFVEFANVYMQGFKIAPRLRTRDAGTPTMNLLHAPMDLSLSRGLELVEVVLHRKAHDLDKVKEDIASAAGLDPSLVQIRNGKARIQIAARRLPELAKIDAVRHVEPVAERKLYNNVALKILTADVVQAQADLRGDGQVIAVCDTGFDVGSTTDVHPAFQGRVKKLYALGRAGNASDNDGHGTHVCGSVLGDGHSSVLNIDIRGTAPRAMLVMQSVLDERGGLGGLPDDLHDLFDLPYEQDGARVHSNSWGDIHGDGSYTQNSFELDDFAYRHRDLAIVFAAGNDGRDDNHSGTVSPGSVGAPSTAKNCICVGASESLRPGFDRDLTYGKGWPNDFPVAPLATDEVADNAEGLAAFSSRGPTKDGRIRPDVVAAGTAILSTRSRAHGVGDGWGRTEDPLYFFDGGTSMATPLVSGCAAVVRQFVMAKASPPSAALVKALLINGARPLAGQYAPPEVGTIPNRNEGFGRIDLAATVGPHPNGTTVRFWDEGDALDTGEEKLIEIDIAAHATLKVTLVWTDPPGETLQNDLDLIVKTARGTERHGNMQKAKGFDRVNNVEQVYLTRVAAGKASITVRAHRITKDPQSYALVVRVVADDGLS